MDENQLIQNILSGDTKAFKQIFDRYKDGVFQICFNFTGDHALAEDACQDIFLKIYKSLHTFQSRSKLSTWIYRIAVNQALNCNRKQKREKQTFDKGLFRKHLDNFMNCNDTNTPHQSLEIKEKQALLARAIRSLPVKQQIVLNLQYFQGFSGPEIANILDCSLSSVQARIHRAKKNLYKKLKPCLEEI